MKRLSDFDANTILAAAQSAFDEVAFFRSFYSTRPCEISDVRTCSYSDYFRAAGVLECIRKMVPLSGVMPPFHRAFCRLPFSMLESEGDIDFRQERLLSAVETIGMAMGSRLLIITDEANGPFACDLSTGLGWEGLPASIFYDMGSIDALAFQLVAHRPDWVIWCLDSSRLSALPFPSEKILLAHLVDRPIPAWDGAVWLFSDEVNLIGARAAGQSAFAVDREQFVWEKVADGRWAITTLKREVFPLVRYVLPEPFEVAL